MKQQEISNDDDDANQDIYESYFNEVNQQDHEENSRYVDSLTMDEDIL